MGSTSQEILRSLCSNTEWKYAVFWKLNHRSRMVLTLEDAYYDNHGHNNSPINMHGEHDPLGLALAKMAYHVYSIGEGIVGHVAVSGEHQWVFPEYYDNWYSASEFHNVWESQISAGIKTILVVPVGPCGVVQLGSLSKVDEDVILVNHIKHMFLALKDPLTDHEANLMQRYMNNSFCLPKLPSECLHVEAFPNCSGEAGKAMDVEESSFLTQYPNLYPYLKNHALNNTSSSALAIEAERLVTDQSYQGLDSTFHTLSTDQESSHQEAERMPERRCESSRFDALISSGYNFPGSELLEALGSGFKQTSRGLEELVKSEHSSAIRPTDDNMSPSQLTFDSAPENLLDAVVANVCHSDGNARDDIFSSRSVQSFLSSMEMAEPSGHNPHIVDNPIDRAMHQQPLVEVDTQQSHSDICGAFSSIGFSSTCPSSSSDHFQTSLEMPKKNKKRAKPGESSRPRPRDRQLIQDRIKELRELVPNGSKCSIDSLLERTIKHMLFLQNVTKHADKLSKSASTKMQQKETGAQGSTCAVEVGGHLQVCSIIVENLNKHGMVLIEMLCEECSHFLEISNVIRSLDLTILRGVTEAQGDKTWICFVVESQSNKVMQRMDILWSLVQIFQPKANSKR
ncbi:Transcription factor bHLH155 [Hirschfeldia incana]|nr:Transcription factor bHLH155 [Hirschfeldia incana]